MRIGVFGGTFDPVHWGHLILAEQCREQAKLDTIWIIPSAHHPFKSDERVSSFEHRAAMLHLAIADQPAFRVDEIERELPAPTYTADTLEALAGRHPNDEWFFLLGGDALAELPTWHDPPRIVACATLVAMARPGHALSTVEELRATLGLPAGLPLRLQGVDVPLIDLSSRDIRRRVARGQSITFMLPRNVENYIAEMGLYRQR